MFCIGDGVIAGADQGGLLYDGILEEKENGSLEGLVSFLVPAGVQLISGMKTTEAQKLTVPVSLAPGFDDGWKVTRIETPAGPINARFERLRELP
jgi:hypothetical protein